MNGKRSNKDGTGFDIRSQQPPSRRRRRRRWRQSCHFVVFLLLELFLRTTDVEASVLPVRVDLTIDGVSTPIVLNAWYRPDDVRIVVHEYCRKHHILGAENMTKDCEIVLTEAFSQMRT